MNKIVRTLVVMVVFAMALTGISLAQSDTYRVTADIPFDFYAGDVQVPAGTYLFKVNYGDHSVTLRNRDTGRSYMLLARPGDGEGFGEAVVDFDVVGDVHLLVDVKTAAEGVSFPEHKAMLAAAQHKGSVAIVASLR